MLLLTSQVIISLSLLMEATASQAAAAHIRRPQDELPPPPSTPPKFNIAEEASSEQPPIGPRNAWEARKPGYVRMPVSRHIFNGTGKWPWGWHWGPPPGYPGGGGYPGGPGPWSPGGGGGSGGWPGGGSPSPGQSFSYPPWPTFTMPSSWPPAWPTYSVPSGYPFAGAGAGGGGGGTTPPAWPPYSVPFKGYPFPWGGFPTPTPPTPQTQTAAGSTLTTATTTRPQSLVVTASATPQMVTTAAAPSVKSGRSAAASVRPRANGSDRRWGWQHLEELGGIAYILQLDIGTPPQKIKVFIDTGSYELWVNPRCNTSADATLCQSYGNYYPNKSNSSNYVGGDFAVTYGTGAVRGSYWSDIMGIAMFQIPGVQFAVANDSNYTFSGILGLGYSYPYSISYPSILQLMVSQKLISGPIFSLGLGGDQDGFSEIIFGGVNRWKFAGPLEPVPIWPPISQQDPHWIQYWVNITSVGMTKPSERPVIYTPRENFAMPVLIDTGSTLSYIREDLVAVIGQQFNAVVDSQGNYIVDCAYRNITNGSVDFGFNKGRMVINVRYKDFIYQQYPGHCMLGVQPADVGSTNYVLGDTFIRGAYLVFVQQSDVVWMNQYYNCGDGVVTVGYSARDTKNIVGAC